MLLCVCGHQLDRFDARHCFDDKRAFGDIASSSVRSEPNGGLKRDALERLCDERYNDLGTLLEERAAAAERARLDAEARAAAALAAAEQERRDAEARRPKNAAVPYQYAPPPKTSKEISAVVVQGELAARDYERERRETPDDVLVPRDSLTREVRLLLLLLLFALDSTCGVHRSFRARPSSSCCKAARPK